MQLEDNPQTQASRENGKFSMGLQCQQCVNPCARPVLWSWPALHSRVCARPPSISPYMRNYVVAVWFLVNVG